LHKVAVIGAAGHVGQNVSLLLKKNEMIGHLNLYDLNPALKGIIADLRHIPTSSQMVGHIGTSELKPALTGMDVVVITAGVPRKRDTTPEELFKSNATIIYDLSVAISQYAPEAYVVLVTSPINSNLPILSEVFHKKGLKDFKRRVFGVSSLDASRASSFVALDKHLHGPSTHVSVIGGVGGLSAVPLLSQFRGWPLYEENKTKYTTLLQNAEKTVLEQKGNDVSATLSMAYSTGRFTKNLIDGLNGKSTVRDHAFIQTPNGFAAVKIELGLKGVNTIFPPGDMDPIELELLSNAKKLVISDVEKGLEFVRSKHP